MLGTDPAGRGGVASVVRQYGAVGMFDGGHIRYLVTHHGMSAGGRLLPPLRGALTLWTALFLDRVQLIHAHTSYGRSFWRKFLITFPALLLGVPVLVHLHSGKFPEFHAEGGAWRRNCLRFLFRRAWRVIAVSEELRRWVLTIEPGARVEVVHNSLAAQTGLSIPTSSHPNPTILFLGRVDENKGAYDLLRAFAAVRSALPSARLVFGGDGDIERFLRSARDLGVTDSVTYVGWADGEQKAKLLAECWVLALPSYKEGLPMTVIEAMAFTRAVVATPVGGIPQAVHDGTTGILVKPGNVAALADGLLRILTDAKTAARMGRAGRALFERHYSHEASLAKLLALYRQAGATDLPILNFSNPVLPRRPEFVGQPASR